MPLFGKSHKSPQELSKNLKEALIVLERGDKKVDKASEETSKILSTMKTMLYGTADQDPQPETVAQLAQEIYNNNLIYTLIKNLAKIDFESKKDVTQIVNNLLRRQIGTRFPTVEQICSKREILTTLLNGYESQDIALNCGMMLRECIRHEPLARMILLSPEFYNFFNYVEVPTFDIASDAFSTFKDLLTRHKFLASEFLETNYDKVFGLYQNLLTSENYVTRRQSLKLLGELILDRHNFNIMTRYISNSENLKLMMNLLRDKSRNIQFEAFHVFKVFVANPNKTKPVADILLRNREKLVEFLSKFQNDRTDDEQFNDEKAYLIKQIKELRPVPALPTPASSQTSTTTNTSTVSAVAAMTPPNLSSCCSNVSFVTTITAAVPPSSSSAVVGPNNNFAPTNQNPNNSSGGSQQYHPHINNTQPSNTTAVFSSNNNNPQANNGHFYNQSSSSQNLAQVQHQNNNPSKIISPNLKNFNNNNNNANANYYPQQNSIPYNNNSGYYPSKNNVMGHQSGPSAAQHYHQPR